MSLEEARECIENASDEEVWDLLEDLPLRKRAQVFADLFSFRRAKAELIAQLEAMAEMAKYLQDLKARAEKSSSP